MSARRVVAYGLAVSTTPTLALVLGALCASQADRTGTYPARHRKETRP